MDRNTLAVGDFIIYGVIFLVTWYGYKILIKPFLSPLGMIPGRPYYPFVGNMLEARRSEAMTNTLRWMTDLKSKLIRFYYFGGQERLLAADPEIFQHVLVTNSKNYHRLDAENSPITWMTGSPPLFLLSGEHHHMMRKICNPGFLVTVLHSMLPVFQERGKALVNVYKQALADSQRADVDIETNLCKLTLDVICECGFQYNLKSTENPKYEELTKFKNLLKGAASGFLDFLPFSSYFPTKKNIKLKTDRKFVEHLTSEIIQAFKERENDKSEKHQDLLSSLMSARDSEGSGLSDKELFGQIIGFLFAGFDTTSTTMTWILLQLAKYPDVQDKVRAEINEVFTDINDVTPEKLDKLKYLGAVVKETMRLYPPFPTIFRKSLAEDTLNGYRIPAGTIVGLHIGALQRLNLEDGDEFKPERYLSPTETESKAHMPFGKGPYMCIGNKFALLEMKTVISRLVKEFRFDWTPGYTYKRAMIITVRPKPPLVLRISSV